MLQALDPSIVKSIDVREGEVVEKARLLATLDPTFAAADVNQLKQQIDSLNAQIARDEAELAHKRPTSPPRRSQPATLRGATEGAVRSTRRAIFRPARELRPEDRTNEATTANIQNDESRYRERLGVASEVESMRTTLAQHGNESRLNLLGSTDTRIEAVRTMEFDHNSLIEAQHQLDGEKADRAAFIQQWFWPTRRT